MSDDDRGILGLLVAIGGVLGVCAIGAVLYFALVAPASEKLAKATGRATTKAKDLERQQINVEDLERRKDNLNRDAARLRQRLSRAALKTDTDPAKADAKLRRLRKRLSASDKMPLLLELLRTAAKRSKVALKEVVPEDSVKEGPLTLTPIKIVATGRYASLIKWMEAVATMKGRLLVPSKLKVYPKKAHDTPFVKVEPDPTGLEGGQRLVLAMTLTNYSLGKDTTGKVVQVINPKVRNKAWRTVRQHFWTFGLAGVDNKRDPFQPQMAEFANPPTIDDKPPPPDPNAPDASDPLAAIEQPDIDESLLPDKPLLAHDTGSYEVMTIFQKDGENVAIVVDPNGKPHTVKVDTKLGNAGGMVIEITDAQVTIDVPDREEPIILNNKEKPEEKEP